MSEKTVNQRPVVRISRLLPATPQEVFDAWTNPESMKEWMCPGTAALASVQLDVRVGGGFRIVMRDETGELTHAGEYREIQPPERLVFTWRSLGTQGQETLVTVALRPCGDETELVLTHELLPDESSAERHTQGWRSIAEKLDAALLRKRLHEQ